MVRAGEHEIRQAMTGPEIICGKFTIDFLDGQTCE